MKGRIHLLPINKIFQDWKDFIWFEDNDTILKAVKPFDFFIEEACAAFYPVPGSNPTVHYHYCGEELHPTGYTFSEYLQLLLHSRGYWYWIKSLCVTCRDSSETIEFFSDMPRIFKDFDEKKARLFKPKTTQERIEF